MKNRFAPSAVFLSITILSVQIFAGPPYQCDDPEPPEKGQFELFFATHASYENKIASGGFPQIEVNFGAMEDLQLSSSVQLAYFDNRTSGLFNYGPGDFELAIKYRFVREGNFRPQAAIFPRIVLPLGDQNLGLGSGNVQVFLPLWLQKSWGPWCAFGGGGCWINPGDGNKNWVFAGAALQRDFGEAISIGCEAFFHSAATVDEKNSAGMNGAFLWHLTKNDHIVFSAGRDAGAYNGYLAFRKLI